MMMVMMMMTIITMITITIQMILLLASEHAGNIAMQYIYVLPTRRNKT